MSETLVRLAAVGDILRRGADDPRSFLVVGAALFALGLYAILTRRSALALAFGLCLLLGAAGLDLAAFARFARGARAGIESAGEGALVSMFALAVAGAQAVLAFALIRAVVRRLRTADLDRLDSLGN